MWIKEDSSDLDYDFIMYCIFPIFLDLYFDNIRDYIMDRTAFNWPRLMI